ncbi:MAG: PBSX family phage terminase large subunit [Turicibacter sp.]|nr:PBSX family phage terminase large subunit [Turicibacter sp.]
MQLNIHARTFSAKFLPLLNDYSHRWEIYKGSAGSGKSHFITQKIIIKALREKRRVMICRRYGTTMRNSVFKLFKDVIESFKITHLTRIKESDMSITLPNGSEIIFVGLDNEEKLLSIAGITDVFIEEVYEVPKEIVDQLNLRMRGKAPNQQIYMAFNPISAKHWLYDFCEGSTRPESSIYSESTFRDNPFLPDEYVKALEDMYRTNPNKARVFCDGNWGADVEGLVYKNHVLSDFDINELIKQGLEVRVGIDWGFVDPTTVVVSLFDKPKKEIYIIGEFYKRGATLEEIKDGIIQLGISKQKMYCDGAEPDKVDYLRRNGFNAVSAKKGAGSVKAGISFLQDMKIICHESCVNVAAELENYVYLKDKKTGQYIEDSYDHDFSHTMDALRYSYSDLYSAARLTSAKLMLGI